MRNYLRQCQKFTNFCQKFPIEPQEMYANYTATEEDTCPNGKASNMPNKNGWMQGVLPDGEYKLNYVISTAFDSNALTLN